MCKFLDLGVLLVNLLSSILHKQHVPDSLLVGGVKILELTSDA